MAVYWQNEEILRLLLQQPNISLEEINKANETTHALDNSITKTTFYKLINGYRKIHYPNEHTYPSGVCSPPGG
jgi:hypothetical protein